MELLFFIGLIYIIYKVVSGFNESSDIKTPDSNYHSKTYDNKATTSNYNRSSSDLYTPRESAHIPKVSTPSSSYVTTTRKKTFEFNSSVVFKIHGNKKGKEYHSYTTYYPKRYRNAPSSVNNDRSLIYRFKDGYNTDEAARIISNCIYNKFKNTPWLSSSTVLAIIPASTAINTETRFREFTKLVSSNLSLTNGYSAIQRINDREKMTELGHGISRVDGLRFNRTIISGNRIILFDDVVTRGGSLNEISNELKRLGATNVIGVFLAETYDSWKHGDPDWHN